MFDLSQIRCFVAVAEELHFSRAALRLNMTQPPLSRQIRLLEHQVGTALLERSSRVVRLTAAGQAFFPDAVRILRLVEESAATARRIAKGAQGTLRIGFTAASGYGTMPEMTRLLRAAVPNVSLTLKELVSSAQLDALDAGQLDIGLLRPYSGHGELSRLSLLREPLLLALPAAEAAAWPAAPQVDALHGRPLIMYSPYEAQYFHQLLNQLFETAAIKPEIVEYVSQIHTMLALVSSGVGVALIPEAASRLRFDGVVLRPLVTDPANPVEMVCVCRHDNTNPLLEVFKNQVLPAFNGRATA